MPLQLKLTKKLCHNHQAVPSHDCLIKMQEFLNLFPSGPSLNAIEQWSDNLKSFQKRLSIHFSRSEVKTSAFDYIQTLLCPVERKNSWQMAEEAGHWRWLEQTAQQPYVLTVSKQQPTPVNFKTHRTDELVGQIQPKDWHRLSCGKGTKGECESDWARIELSYTHPEGFKRWFLFHRDLKHPDKISYYQVFAAEDTSLKIMAEVAGQRWRIEECFEFAKDHLGLGDYEVRSWTGWHRHTCLVLAAQAFLAVLRPQLEPLPDLSIPSLFLRPRTGNSLAAFKEARGLSSG